MNPRRHNLIAFALLVGAVVAEALMLYAGRNNPWLSITVLFVFWVSAPFVLLEIANLLAQRKFPGTRSAVTVLTALLIAATWIVYLHRVLNPPRAQAAFVFVMLPPLSCLVIVVGVSIAAFVTRRS